MVSSQGIVMSEWNQSLSQILESHNAAPVEHVVIDDMDTSDAKNG